MCKIESNKNTFILLLENNLKCNFFQTSSEFASELAKRGVTVSQYAAQTYDAVWAMAVAISKSEAFLNKKNVSFAQYTHKRQDLAYYLLGQMKELHFNGVSVIIYFQSIFYLFMHLTI